MNDGTYYPKPLLDLKSLIAELPSGNTVVHECDEGYTVTVDGEALITIHVNASEYDDYSLALKCADLIQVDQSVLPMSYPDNKRTFLMAALGFMVQEFTDSPLDQNPPADNPPYERTINLAVMAERCAAILKSGYTPQEFIRLTQKEQNQCLPNHLQH